MKAFEVNKTYNTRFITDSNCILNFKILKRTEKRLTFELLETQEIKTVGVKIMDGEEIAYPLGRYSLAPIIRATREV